MGARVIWLLLLPLAILALWAASALAERRRRPMDDAARADAPGQFARLASGVTHYRWDGPTRGPVAVCIHGLSTGCQGWDPVAGNLAMMGYRVLRYDLYGRGLSDRPGGDQDRAFFLTQLRELLADQGLRDGLMLVGYSMGGSIAAAFAAEAPEKVDRIILLAPAGLGHTPDRGAEFCRRVPVLGDWLFRLFGARQVAEARFRGYLPAVLSSRRHMLTEDMAPEHRIIAQQGIPVLAIWGEQDAAIPLTAVGRLAQINPAAWQVELPGATHALPVTHPGEIHAAVQEFLREL